MTTVQEIHNEFFSAEERLLQEAKELIANPQVAKANKAERYTKLGFGSCKPVKEALELADKHLKSKELQKTIEYFQQHYPANKFITEPEVKRICEKYGLLLGDATNYIGDIPEKNLGEIERFKLRQEDFMEKERGLFFWSRTVEEEQRSESIGFVSSRRRQSGLSDWLSDYGMMMPRMAYGVDPYPRDQAKVEKEKPAFKICAPKQDFNTAGYVVTEGFKLIYDPVVLQPVKGGFLIVSAWGEEASDELVVNTKLN